MIFAYIQPLWEAFEYFTNLIWRPAGQTSMARLGKPSIDQFNTNLSRSRDQPRQTTCFRLIEAKFVCVHVFFVLQGSLWRNSVLLKASLVFINPLLTGVIKIFPLKVVSGVRSKVWFAMHVFFKHLYRTYPLRYLFCVPKSRSHPTSEPVRYVCAAVAVGLYSADDALNDSWPE